MPLCQVNRTDRARGRNYSCIVEHGMSHDEYIGCSFIARSAFVMPDHKKKYIPTRTIIQRNQEDVQKKKEMSRKGGCSQIRQLLQLGGARGRGCTGFSWFLLCMCYVISFYFFLNFILFFEWIVHTYLEYM